MNQNAGKHFLSEEIQKAYHQLVKIVLKHAPSRRISKVIEGTGGKLSVANLIAYQIGWGKALIRWYEAGIQGEIPEMPGDGFSNWDYTSIAKHFYKKYHYDAADQQMQVFHGVVERILEIIQTEYQLSHLDCLGIWTWCRLSSGKEWPLSKWVKVNTVSPYKRATLLIKKASLQAPRLPKDVALE